MYVFFFLGFGFVFGGVVFFESYWNDGIFIFLLSVVLLRLMVGFFYYGFKEFLDGFKKKTFFREEGCFILGIILFLNVR